MENKDETPEVDPTVHKAIAAIISKDPGELSEPDKAFLRARASYLGKNARRKFAEVLSEKTQPEEKKEEANKDLPKEEAVDNSQHPAQTESTQPQETEDDVE